MLQALLSKCYSGLLLQQTIACFEQSLMGILLCESVFVSLCVVYGLLLFRLSDSGLWLGDLVRIGGFVSLFA